MPNGTDGELSCKVYSTTAHAFVTYWHKAHFHLRGDTKYTGQVVDLYAAGDDPKHRLVPPRRSPADTSDNPTVATVDGCLTCILGREAAARHGRLTMDELLKENKHLELDLTGLKI